MTECIPTQPGDVVGFMYDPKKFIAEKEILAPEAITPIRYIFDLFSTGRTMIQTTGTNDDKPEIGSSISFKQFPFPLRFLISPNIDLNRTC